MEKITLVGVSRKGKNRINELGNEWWVILHRDCVSFSVQDRLPFGGWLLIAPVENTEKIRWIRRNEDPDFLIIRSQIVQDS